LTARPTGAEKVHPMAMKMKRVQNKLSETFNKEYEIESKHRTIFLTMREGSSEGVRLGSSEGCKEGSSLGNLDGC
jgi:hypothetical protein